MEAIIERCCGLDVHQASVVACLLVGPAHRKPRKEVRTFGTLMRDLVALRDWLSSQECTDVAMESTGIYWKPVYAVLEGIFEVVVGNAQRIKNVPGRKTDVNDAEWIADLLRHGLISPSFVPPKPIRELRDLTRYRTTLVNSRSAECNRLLKLLESANVKLATVLSDVFGVSGTLMVKALVEGEASLEQMAQLAKGAARKKIPELELALDGKLEEHHRYLLSMQIQRIEVLDANIAELEKRINERLQPYAKQVALLRRIPGVDWAVAAVIVAELGVDMTVFPSAQQAAAWVGVSPGNNESAGKRKSGRITKGNVYLKTALVQAAHAASRKKGSYLKDKFFRLKARRGPRRAAVAISHKILLSAYTILKTGQAYTDLGDAYLDRLDKRQVATNLIRRLERLGYDVHLEDKAA